MGNYYEQAFSLLFLLMGYRKYLKSEQQQEIIDCIFFGLTTKNLPFTSKDSALTIQKKCLHALCFALVEFPAQLLLAHVINLCENHFVTLVKEQQLIHLILDSILILSTSKGNVVESLTASAFQKLFKLLLQLIDSSKVSKLTEIAITSSSIF